MEQGIALGRWLIVPLVALLAAQWPLREVVHAYANNANDMAQIAFGLYAVFALAQATRSDAHLRALVRPASPWVRIVAAFTLLIWSLGIVWLAVPMAWTSTLQLEHFAEGTSHGYFVLRWALVLLAGAQAVLQAQRLLQCFKPAATEPKP